MIVKIENRYLQQAISLLFDLPLRGKQSRHRTKFIKLLQNRLKEVEEERVQLAKEYAEKDENGNPIVENNRYKIAEKYKEEFFKEFEALMSEELVIEGENFKETLEVVRDILLNCDEYFSGEQAFVYDYLCEQFEKGDEE